MRMDWKLHYSNLQIMTKAKNTNITTTKQATHQAQLQYTITQLLLSYMYQLNAVHSSAPS